MKLKPNPNNARPEGSRSNRATPQLFAVSRTPGGYKLTRRVFLGGVGTMITGMAVGLKSAESLAPVSSSIKPFTGGRLLLNTSQKGAIPRAHGGAVSNLVVAEHGGFLASTGWDDRVIKLWSIASGELIHKFERYRSWINRIALDPEGRTIAISGSEKSIELWNSKTGKPQQTLNSGYNRCVAFDRSGRTLASSGGDGWAVKLWDIPGGKLLRTLDGHKGSINEVLFNPTSNTLASSSSDGTIKVWEIDSGKPLYFTPAGNTPTSPNTNSKSKGWETASSSPLYTLNTNCYDGWGIAFNPDGSILAGIHESRVTLWEASSGKLLRSMEKKNGSVQGIAFHPQGKLLASGGANDIVLWDVASSHELRTLKGHNQGIRALTFSPDGMFLFSGDESGVIIVWEMEGARRCWALSDPDLAVGQTTLSAYNEQQRIPAVGICTCDTICTCNTVWLPSGSPLPPEVACLCNTDTVGKLYAGGKGERKMAKTMGNTICLCDQVCTCNQICTVNNMPIGGGGGSYNTICTCNLVQR